VAQAAVTRFFDGRGLPLPGGRATAPLAPGGRAGGGQARARLLRAGAQILTTDISGGEPESGSPPVWRMPPGART